MNRISHKRLYAKRLSVAPMIDWTDRACRSFHRILAPRAFLYTEMITTGALIYGDAPRHLICDAMQQPVVLQLGGCDPDDMAESARLAQAYGYEEVNINCGCPSERVQKGAFGACLMREPHIVAACVRSMQAATPLPVTVKCRIGVDDDDSPAFLSDFVARIADAGCERFILHARKAWLQGLSPKQNREIPPLIYDRVEWIKQQFPHLAIEINGGFTTHEAVRDYMDRLDGVMIGRAAYQTPWFLAELSGQDTNREACVRAYRAPALAMIDDGVPLRHVLRPMIGLYNGMRGGRHWRRMLSELPQDTGIDFDTVIERATPSPDSSILAA